MSNIPFEKNRDRAKEILEIVHTEDCEHFQTIGFEGKKYFVTFLMIIVKLLECMS